MTSISSLLAEVARQNGTALALVDDARGRRLSFGQLQQEVAGAASWLAGQGFRRNDAILVFVPMSADLYVALLAMFRLGIVALFLDPAAGATHLELCCERWPPKGLLAIPKAHLLRLKSTALRRIPRKIVIGGWAPFTTRWRIDPKVGMDADPTVAPGDPALVTFTSGSTGRPKAAVRTHGFLLAQYRALAPNLHLERSDVDLATLPIFALVNLAAGITTVIPEVDLRRPGAVDGRSVFQQIGRSGVTRATASPAFFDRLVEYAESQGIKIPSLTKLYTGGAPVYPRLLHKLKAIAPQAEVVAVYGSTEAEPIAHIEAGQIKPEDQAAMQAGRGLLAGPVVPQIQLRVIRDQWGTPLGRLSAGDFEALVMPAGREGEIVVAGEHVLPGYLDGEGDAATKFSVEGVTWHRTGDAGRTDPQGRLWLLGRCAAKIEDQRGLLYPFGVETAAMAFPWVERAAAIAHDRRRYLFVQTRTGLSSAQRTELAHAIAWASMDEIKGTQALPLDQRHNAKIDYPALRAMLAGGKL